MLNKTRKPQSVTKQLLALTLIQLSNWRWAWRNMLLVGSVMPLVTILSLGSLADQKSPEVLSYILTGNVVVALMFDHQTKLASNFAYMRYAGTLSYLYTLPIRRFLIIIASNIAFFILSLPSLGIVIFIGSKILNISLNLSPYLIIIIPLCAVTLAALGALIGISFDQLEEAMMINRLIVLLMVVIGPVIIPADRLHPILRIAGFASPATYAASAMRQTLLGPITERLIIDVGVMLMITIISYGWVNHKMQHLEE